MEPRRYCPLLSGLVALLLAAPAAAADGAGPRSGQPPLADPYAIIAGCESRYSDSLNSGNEERARRARLGIVSCIRSAALENAVVLLGQDQRETISESFRLIEEGIGGFYRTLYGEERGAFSSPVNELRDIYVDILRDVLRQREFNNPM